MPNPQKEDWSKEFDKLIKDLFPDGSLIYKESQPIKDFIFRHLQEAEKRGVDKFLKSKEGKVYQKTSPAVMEYCECPNDCPVHG